MALRIFSLNTCSGCHCGETETDFYHIEPRREGEASVTIHPDDASSRGIAEGQMVRISNDRGSFLARARVSDAARPGLVVGLSIWWAKMCPGGRNANAVTGQELTDMGGGATFYDVLVDVAPAEPAA